MNEQNQARPDPAKEAAEIIDSLSAKASSEEEKSLYGRLRNAIQHVQYRGARTGVVAGAAIQLAESESPAEVLGATLDEAIRLTGAERGFILMWNEEKRALERVTEYSFRCGRHMGLSPDRLVMLHSAALLHDVGKIGIRDAVLHKPGKLTDEEYEHVKLHAELSEEIVKGLSYLDDERAILAASQEHFDGSGYPRGTKGDEISIEAYIIQVADAWDAMTSTRVYRVAMPKEDAAEELRRWSGRQFHPEVVDAFLEMIEEEGSIPSD